MGNGRFLYNNLITAESMLSVSSLRKGIVTSALKDGTGSAELNPSGPYTGAVDREYIVEIDSVAGGAEIGQATYRWSDGGSGWNASGVTTAASGLILGYGITIGWTAGAGADFVDGDRWYFKGINLFNAGKMLDGDRDTRYRSDELESPNTITIDLGAAAEVKALALYDHNFTSLATLLLEADDAATFDSDGGSAQFSEAITWASEKILHYLSAATTKRYWRISVTDASNPDSYIEIGEIFLGSYLELSRNYLNGFTEDIDFLRDSNETRYGIAKHRFYNTRMVFGFSFSFLSATDIASMRSLVNSICNRSSGKFSPLFFCPDSATPGTFYLVEIEPFSIQHIVVGEYAIPLRFREVVSSV